MGGDRLSAGAELDNRRTILGIFVPDGLFVPVGGEDALPGQLVVGVIAVNDGIDQRFAGDHLICTERDVALGGAHNSAVLVCISILFSLHYVNRSDNIPLSVIDVFVVRYGCCRVCACIPLFGRHLTDRVVACLHHLPVCVGDGFQPPAAVLVCVSRQLLTLAGNSDALQIMERVVCERILHTVSAGNLGHVIKSVIDIRYMGKLCAISLFACHLCRFSGIVIRIRRLVPEPVGYFFAAGGVLV